MRIVMFVHSLASDWNHGNAHFLRGVATELQARGHEVVAYEPADGWSRRHLLADHGPAALAAFHRRFPHLRTELYDWPRFDLEAAVAGADLVLVHEWNDPALVRALGALPRRRFVLLFHDTHHRAVTAPEQMAAYDLSGYDGVLAFGRVLAELYRARGWARRAWVWHEAADVRVFHPRPGVPPEGDLVWVGNWGDEERTAELEEFLLEPVERLGLRATVYGVRYPPEARARLARAGIRYGGYLPNWCVPEVFARHRLTVHVPRRPYATALPGISTIRPFEALACGMPLVSAPWEDRERLFHPGRDFLVARDGAEMTRLLARLLRHPDEARALGRHGWTTVRARHTCAHRVDALLHLVHRLRADRCRDR